MRQLIETANAQVKTDRSGTERALAHDGYSEDEVVRVVGLADADIAEGHARQQDRVGPGGDLRVAAGIDQVVGQQVGEIGDARQVDNLLVRRLDAGGLTASGSAAPSRARSARR